MSLKPCWLPFKKLVPLSSHQTFWFLSSWESFCILAIQSIGETSECERACVRREPKVYEGFPSNHFPRDTLINQWKREEVKLVLLGLFCRFNRELVGLRRKSPKKEKVRKKISYIKINIDCFGGWMFGNVILYF